MFVYRPACAGTGPPKVMSARRDPGARFPLTPQPTHDLSPRISIPCAYEWTDHDQTGGAQPEPDQPTQEFQSREAEGTRGDHQGTRHPGAIAGPRPRQRPL